MLRYFVGHPQAADDLEGIARWRLAADAIQISVDETERALAWLVERGYLRVTHTTSTPVFSLNAAKMAEATALLMSDQPSEVAGREDGNH